MLRSGYGEGAPQGRGPSQGTLQAKGNPYLASNFPKLSQILSVVIAATAADGSEWRARRLLNRRTCAD